MAVTVASLKAVLSLDKEQFEKGLAGAKSGLSSFGKGIATGAVAGVGAGIAAVGAGMAATGTAAVNLATDIDQATRDIQGSLGVTEDKAKQLGDVAKNVFANNFGESVQDTGKVVANLAKQMPDLDGQELQTAAQNAYMLSDAFGADLDKSVNASATLMKQFGLTQQEAFDFMASGFQKGLDSSGDFLDSIGEYSNLFAQNGFAAEEFFSAMETGVQGGVLGTDKIADAFKEAGIKIQEVSDDTLDSLELIGVNVDKLYQGLISGDTTAADALKEILPAINAIEDPIARNAMGVKIFGTMWEDLGSSAFTGLDLAKTGLNDMDGAMQALNAQYENFSALSSEVWRELLIALQPAAEEFLRLANEAMPFVKEVMAEVAPVVQSFAAEFGEKLGPALQIIVNSLNRIGEALGLTNGEMSGAEMIAAALGVALDVLVTALEATAVGFHLLSGYVETISKIVKDFNGFVERGVRGWWDAADALRAMADAAADLVASNIGSGSLGGNLLNIATGGISGGIGKLFGFATGGTVPGQMGQPQLAIVHGGEHIIPVNGNTGGGINITIGSVSASSDSNSVDEAIRMTVDLLRSQLARAAG